MIALKPVLENVFQCPVCHAVQPEMKDVIFQGIRVLADCRCKSCGYAFLHDYPTGFGMCYPVAIGKEDARTYNLSQDKGCETWRVTPLKEGFLKPEKEEVKIEKVVYRPASKVIILNALDFCFSHVLKKLLNAQRYLDEHPEMGLIILIPKAFEYLVPEGVAEAWYVHLSIRALNGWFPRIDAFVKKEWERFEEVFLGQAYPHPDTTRIDISRFTGVQPFDISTFAQKKPHITFALREDLGRLWFHSRLEFMLREILHKFNINIDPILVRRQNALVKSTIKKIRRQLPDAEFSITGFGGAGSFEGLANDYRIPGPDPEYQKNYWFKTYAKSHLVIGIAGSHMYMAAAHSAGVIDIFYPEFYHTYTDDLFFHTKGIRETYLNRYVQKYIKASEVAAHAVAMIRYFKRFNRGLNHDAYHYANKPEQPASKPTI
ncbi:MAG: hypothetical protein D6730_04165 [Bacteroidetes bacterium]|nr:MAG: hypothetical protein D6730_04165 [Bacteroidota bacterium]